jgi:cytoskeletal protein CcmA (bactofilin family)
MSVAHTNPGQTYWLARAVLRMDEFTVSELQDLSGAGETTVQSFLNKLEAAGPEYLRATELLDEELGATKRYSLTPAGTTYLLTQSLEMTPRLEKTAPSSGAAVARTPAPVSTDQATIGKSVVVKGEITGDESLYIDGKVEGAINLPGQRVTVGPNGTVSANILARDVVVLGKARGNVHASDRVDIREGASLVGDIIAQRISIEDGAFFKGDIDLGRRGQIAEPAMAVEKSKVSAASQFASLA